MDMRELIAKMTAIEEEAKKDKDYDHDSLDKDDEDYIEKNSKEDDEKEYEPGEEDEVKESKDNEPDEDDNDEQVDENGLPSSYYDSKAKSHGTTPETVKDKLHQKLADLKKSKSQMYGESIEESEEQVTECGGEMTSIPSQNQTDTVSMTINMSGSGKGGIHDILDVIRNIEKGNPANASVDSHMGGDLSPPVGDKELNHDATMIIGGGDTDRLEDDLNRMHANSPNEKYSTLKSLGGENSVGTTPYTADVPAIKSKLDSLYDFVKSK